MILRPLKTYLHAPMTALKKVPTPKADPRVTTERSYRYLVTQLNVGVAQAARLLGRPPSA